MKTKIITRTLSAAFLLTCAVTANAQVVSSQAFEVVLSGGLNNNSIKLADGRTFEIQSPDEAYTTGPNPQLLLPQFTRPGAGDSDFRRQWDTEQIIRGAPMKEQLVMESRAGNRVDGGDWEFGSFWVDTPGTIPERYAGNNQPDVSVTDNVNTNRVITSGQTDDFTLAYNAATRQLTFSYANAGSTTSAAMPSSMTFTDIILRVNATVQTGRTYTLSVSDLLLTSPATGNVATQMLRDIDNTLQNTITASATDGALNRQFAVWQEVVDDTADFVITGQNTYTWAGGDPSGSRMAFQFKFAETLEDFVVVPEPAAFGGILLGFTLGWTLLRRRRR